MNKLLLGLLLCTGIAWAETAVPAQQFKWPTTPVRIKLTSVLIDCDWRDGRPYCQRADLVRYLHIPAEGETSVDLIQALVDKGWVVRRDHEGDIQALRPSQGPSPAAIDPPGAGAVPRSFLTSLNGREAHPTKQVGTGSLHFQEIPPGGALLTGFSVTCHDWMGFNIIQSIRGVYISADGPVLGLRHGGKTTRTQLIEAKEGYAVGGLNVRAGLLVNGFSVIFMRVENGRLNPRDSYNSEWVGDRRGGGESQLAGDGSLVVGYFGKDKDPKDKEQWLCGMGLMILPLKK